MHLTAGILGLIGNTMVFIAFALSKRLQTKTNMFVVNLAFADFLTSILMPIFAWSLIADVLFPVPEWIDTMCALAIGAAQGSVGCSLVTLSLIAMNRLILITRKRKTYERIYRNRNVAIFICIAWLYPFACEIIPLLFGIGELGFDEVAHICGTKTNHEHSYIYDVLVVGLLIPVPLLIISYSYARIFCFIRIHNKQLGEHRQPSRDCSRVRFVCFSIIYLFIAIPCQNVDHYINLKRKSARLWKWVKWYGKRFRSLMRSITKLVKCYRLLQYFYSEMW